MTAVTYKIGNTEIYDDTENAFTRMQSMRREEKRYARRQARYKAQQKKENIKLFFVLLLFNVILPMAGFCHWIMVGY